MMLMLAAGVLCVRWSTMPVVLSAMHGHNSHELAGISYVWRTDEAFQFEI